MLIMRHLILRNLIHLKNIPACSNQRILPRFKSSYDGDGKTHAKIMNEDAELGLMINGYSTIGFRLNNNMTVLGPMAIFPKTVLSWNIKSFHDVNEDSLSLFSILEPKLDILVLGTGDQTNDTTFMLNVIRYSRKHKISIEILPTDQAVSTFNFLNSEGRCVAGALIPPNTVRTSEDETMTAKLRYQKLYELDD